ncbi:MAG TPA: hypothetical protein VGH19_22585 [Verrucomicrobiae bacterium]
MRFANVYCAFIFVLLVACSKQEESSVAPPPSAVASVDVTPPAPAATPDQTAPPPVALPATAIPASAVPQEDPKEYKDIDGKTISLIEYLESLASGYERTRASQSDGTPWPPLTSLDQLVAYRFVSRLPAAPVGQKFVYDPQTGKVSLAAK